MQNSGAARRENAKSCLGMELKRNSPAVITRMPVIQYSRELDDGTRSRGVLDTPQEPVIGLAEGETRWRDMTEACGKPQSGLYD